MYKLVVVQGSSSSQKEFYLKEGKNFIGRGETCDVQFSFDFISKKHSCIKVSSNEIWIEDLNSRNGTFVNGVMVKKQLLRAGDKISFRDVILELRTGKKEKHYFQEGFNVLVQNIEWRYFTLGLLFLFIVVHFFITVHPLLSDSKNKLRIEALKRAEFIAKNISKQSQKYLNLKNNILIADHFNLSFDLAKQEERISSIGIINPQTKRIIAPIEKLDQAISNKGAFLRGADTKSLSIEKLNEQEVLISQPIFLYSSIEDREVIGAVLQMVFNLEGIGPSFYESFNTSLKYFFFALMIGGLFYFLLQQYLKTAFQKMHGEIERASKKGFKPEELKTKLDEEKATYTDDILKNLLSALSDGVLIVNHAYHVIQMNPICQKIFHLKEDETLNKNILNLIKDQELLKNISHGLGQASLGFPLEEEVQVGLTRYQLTILASKNPQEEVGFYIIKLRGVTAI